MVFKKFLIYNHCYLDVSFYYRVMYYGNYTMVYNLSVYYRIIYRDYTYTIIYFTPTRTIMTNE